jgi:methionine synthase II (cobalamin-independent)
MMPKPIFAAAPSVVGSFPHADPHSLVNQILDCLPEIPAWPQMPARDWRESMYVQYSEKLPGAVLDSQDQRLYFRVDDLFHEQLEGFYQAVIAEDVDYFDISRNFALGLHIFLETIVSRGPGRPDWVKGQVTGPFSFAMTVTDENKRSLAYNPELYEVAVQGMAMKARSVARMLLRVGAGAIVVLDEPYLCSFGSAFVNVTREDVVAAIETGVSAIHKEGALAGLHCCGNTDWSLVLGAGLDVINFDAFEFFQGLSLYPAELAAFLGRGGTLSWGIVPAAGADESLSASALLETLDERVKQLVAKGIDREALYRQAILTPSCGLGTQSVEKADRVLNVLVELSQMVREREGLL